MKVSIKSIFLFKLKISVFHVYSTVCPREKLQPYIYYGKTATSQSI